MTAPKFLILTAVTMEARAVRRALIGEESKFTDGGAVGIRAVRLESIKVASDISTVILCGLGGALNPAWAVGDVILDDPAELVPPSVRLRRGRIFTSTDIVATPAGKAAFFESTGADAVDMEQSIVRKWCENRGLPLIGLRAISDSAEETLDPAVLGFVNELGQPRSAKIALGLLRRPHLLAHLLRLNANSNVALRKLSMAIRSVVENIGAPR